jgi:hypothetical protein
MSLVDIHARLASTAVFYSLALFLWGLWRYFRKEGVDGSYWGALAIAELLILIQGILGTYLWVTGLRPGQLLHLLYGVVGVLTIPTVFAYTRGRDSRSEMLIYGLVMLFLGGILLRAIMTGY